MLRNRNAAFAAGLASHSRSQTSAPPAGLPAQASAISFDLPHRFLLARAVNSGCNASFVFRNLTNVQSAFPKKTLFSTVGGSKDDRGVLATHLKHGHSGAVVPVPPARQPLSQIPI